MKMNKILLVVALLVSVHAAQAGVKSFAQNCWKSGCTKASALWAKVPSTPAFVTNAIEGAKSITPIVTAFAGKKSVKVAAAVFTAAVVVAGGAYAAKIIMNKRAKKTC